MQLKMWDNKGNGKVCDELVKNIQTGSRLSVISAYFTIYAFDELRKELEKIESMKFIFTEPTFVKDDNDITRQYFIDRNPERKISGNEFEIKLRNEMRQAHIARECAQWAREKVEFKSLRRPNPAQQRLIHIDNQGEDVAINGSVDFTTDGLGITHSNRVDINTCMYGREFTDSYLRIFDQLWRDETIVKDIKTEVLEQMQIIYKENSPRFFYFITLYNIFNDYLDELTEENIVKTRTGIKNTDIWNMLYKFQKDGVLGAINKLEKYNGCIIADSVGLGKTFEALAVIKYYELRNDRVLVLCPKKLRENWTIYAQNDKRNILLKDRFNYDVLNHTDLSRYTGLSGAINLSTVNWSNYDLVVIDESHNFRNNPAREDRVTRYARLMKDIIKAGVKTKVLMLSATPVNNRMNDIKNQIAFITEGVDNAFAPQGIPSIELTLKKSQRIFNQWSKLSDAKRTTDTFVEMIGMDYFKLLDIVTLARSRKHIEKYYDIAEIGEFPERRKPVNIYADIDLKNEFPPLSGINKMIKNLSMAVYSPSSFILPGKRDEYSEIYDKEVKGGSIFRQTDREQALTGLMRIGLLKRMESSIHSFGLTISRLLGSVNIALKKINENQFSFDPDINILNIDFDDETVNDLLIGNKVKVLLQDMDLVKWRQSLEEDRQTLEILLAEAQKITSLRDAKLQSLKQTIAEKIKNPINQGNKKVIVFSAFADTADYLYLNLAEWMLREFGLFSALVTGRGSNTTTLKTLPVKDFNSILTNFSPISKYRDKLFPEITDEIDLLIATDCISEGQNLQDCDFLINYDIHWNPVRIIQRFGRIDRIGSQNNEIQLVNYWPNLELDEYINLEARVTGKMVLLDISATGDENIIAVDPSKSMNDLEYRKKQLKQLQEEVVDIEDIAGGISITDLTLNDFKMDLMEYMKTNRPKLDSSPLGMYAITEIPDELQDQIQPGVIFTLKQVNSQIGAEKQNVLYPYYLVYIGDDGTVKYNFLHSKKVMDFFKKLCSAQEHVLYDLVEVFNQKTDDSKDMSFYSELLSKSIDNIVGKNEEVGIASLFSKGGTTLKINRSSGLEDFELVSFLIIR
ncbi:MAG: DEAD/DEAH box helicase family protein [Anaerolineaceae bacterium]|nr:DEAD/DEAH box helicase family protein [Anaerolineaceae bacterium]